LSAKLSFWHRQEVIVETNKRRVAGRAIIYGVAAIVAITTFLSSNRAMAQESGDSKVITSGRPLNAAADLIQVRMAEQGSTDKVITYEDPILMWEGDVTQTPGVNRIYPKNRTFSLPDELDADKIPELTLDLFQRILAAYHRDTDGPRFRVLSSRWGFHIVPTEVRDVTGRLVSISPLLDTPIAVPIESREPSGHFKAICDALASASGIKMTPGAFYLDQAFAPNGIVPPRARQLTENEKKQVSFAWGANSSAREAIMSLIEPSATTLRWSVRCALDSGGRNCVLNLNPISIHHRGISPDGTPAEITTKTFYHDRKTPLVRSIENVKDGTVDSPAGIK
jgi:hypothetical protein